MLGFLYTVIIYPLCQIVEFAFRVFFAITGNTGVAIIGVSVAITLLCLPLYAVAEKWQEVERNLQKSMAGGVARIKETFSGDEQYMILSTFYRQHNYTPLMQLRSSFGLLIQIPFFIAAYQFLNNNNEILGQGFLFIKDLGKGDELLKLGSLSINILPIAMTLINIISGVIYSKGHPLREKLQIYIMALIFLVILYQSPSGLVLYWTMNNVFGLIKNIFYKLRNPLKAFYIFCCTAATFGVIYVLLKARFQPRQRASNGIDRNIIVAVLALYILILAIPFILKICKYIFKKPLGILIKDNVKSATLFITTCFGLAFLCGIVIPSFLMTTSISEYCYLEGHNNPLFFLYNSFVQSLGLFVFWPVCIYFLFNKKVKAAFAFLLFTGLLCSIINTFAFQGNYGIVLPEVIFTEHRSFIPKPKEFLLNTLVLTLIIGGVYLLFRLSLYKIVSFIASTVLLCTVIASVVNVSRIATFYKSYDNPVLQMTETDRFINLSKTKKNVIVFMIDSSSGYIIDEVFNHRPSLYKQFDGFVKYPNCASFGSWTIQAGVCLYGGYEYTPWNMNHRRDIPMVDKQNEGISLEANIFSQHGYKSTIINPPYPNYDEKPYFKAFDPLPNTTAMQTTGKYKQLWCAEHDIKLKPVRSNLIKRNFLWFGIFKCVPMIFRSAVHYKNFWGDLTRSNVEDVTSIIAQYAMLDYLPRFTNFDNDTNCFVVVENDTTHDHLTLQLPDYKPVQIVDNSSFKMDKWERNGEFHVNTAAYILLGKYFDYLRENSLYDNTKIIITADNGSNTRMKDLFDESIGPDMLERFNPVLMVKDFNATGKMQNDMKFMTNCDVPIIAINGSPSENEDKVLFNEKNPYTGKILRELTTEEKNKQAVISFSRALSVRENFNNGFKIKDDEWYTVKDNIFRASNWKHEMPNYNNTVIEN